MKNNHKKILGICAVLSVCAVMSIFAGCYDKTWTDQGGTDVRTKTTVIKGHEYIIADNYYGICIVHSESCDCRKKDD